MGKRTPNYLVVLLLFVVAGAATYHVRGRPVKVTFAANLAAFPMKLGTWQGVNDEMTPEVQKGIGADSVVARTYTQPGSDYYMGLLVAYRKYGRRGFVHRPEMCYPAAGWEIVGQGYANVPYNGRNTRAVKIVAEKQDAKEVVLYWFASGERVEANYVRQQLWMALDRLQTQKYGWAFIRINSPVITSEEDTLRQIREFMASASDPLVRVLTGPTRAASLPAPGRR